MLLMYLGLDSARNSEFLLYDAVMSELKGSITCLYYVTAMYFLNSHDGSYPPIAP